MEELLREPATFGPLCALAGVLLAAWWSQGGVQLRRSRNALALLEVYEKTPEDWPEREDLKYTARYAINRLTLNERQIDRRIAVGMVLVLTLSSVLVLLLLTELAGEIFGESLPWPVVVVLCLIGAGLGLLVVLRHSAVTAWADRRVTAYLAR